MLKELKSNEFYKVKGLLKGSKVNLEPLSTVLGYSPGTMYVDDVSNVKSAVIWVYGMKGFYLVGNSNNNNFNKQLGYFFDNVLIPHARDLNYKWIEMSTIGDGWHEVVNSVFKDKNGYAISKQYVYKHKQLQEFNVPDYSLSSKYKICKIDSTLLNMDLINKDFLDKVVLMWWSNFESYLKNGIGYAILDGNKVACTCITSFKKPDSMESHIHTLEEYRKQGLATVAVSHFLRYCKQNNINPYWDCMEKNYGSRALATKLGYKKDFDYPLYEYIIE